MNYVSIDIETTGLEPEKHAIVEFAAIYDDGVSDIHQLPIFHRVIVAEDAIWSLYCLKLHEPWYLDELKKNDVCKPSELMVEFGLWCQGLGLNKITAAGKNFGSFDLQFLKRQMNFNPKLFRYRCIDAGMLCLKGSDDIPPDLNECLSRCGIEKTVSHRALDDAMDVVKVIRHKLYGEI